MTPKSLANRAALEALFHPAAAIFQEPELPLDIPSNLDHIITAEEGQFAEVPLFRWFTGKDRSGVVHFFKFQRGQVLASWHALLQRQRLCEVNGPFRTLAQARATAPSA